MNTEQRSVCYHCGEPIPADERRQVVIEGVAHPVCCAGCEAVANLVLGQGLAAYYRFRPAPAPTARPPADGRYAAYARPQAEQAYVHRQGELCTTDLLIEGLRCAACAWLIEQTVTAVTGVQQAHVNPASGRAHLSWRADQADLPSLLTHIAQLGYEPHPLEQDRIKAVTQRERQRALKELAVAGIGMMQVMMYSVGLYFGAFAGIEPIYAQFLRLVSLLIATPVVFYAGRPFLREAWNALRSRRLSMDVPIALAILIGYLASVWGTLTHTGQVYFDSITMFIFFIGIGRFVEMGARHRVSEHLDALVRLLPGTAIRMHGEISEEVLLSELAAGDVVRVLPGTVVPADGEVVQGDSRLDESLLTGEATPVARRTGEGVLGGTLNLSASLDVRLLRVGSDTVISHIGRLLHQAQAERPYLARLADRISGYFVAAVLLLALLTFVYWHTNTDRALQAVLAVLVVSCPCALSLATPTALAAGTAALLRQGILVTKASALETLSQVRHLLLDKTGTLTYGQLQVQEVLPLGRWSEPEVLDIAAALEAHSRHPIASAFRTLIQPSASASEVRTQAGAGLEGRVTDRHWRIGTADFAAGLTGGQIPAEPPQPGNWILLADAQGPAAWFKLGDTPRREAKAALEALGARGLTFELASGDHPQAVQALAQTLGMTRSHSRLTPESKLALIRQRQAELGAVAMVGDGINDAPVLAGAEVAIAMGAGSALAHACADLILLGDDLAMLPIAIDISRQTRRIIRQNLAWALAYNLLSIPLAAAGWIPPWVAAIGMSASSLLVVFNARRIRQRTVLAPQSAAPSRLAQELS